MSANTPENNDGADTSQEEFIQPEPPELLKHCLRTWTFGNADQDKPWAFKEISQEDLKQLIEKLGHFETMDEGSIKRGGSHPIVISKLSKAARKKLKAQNLDHLEELFSFRITSKKRLWCIEHVGLIEDKIIYSVLWWDPNHQVCS